MKIYEIDKEYINYLHSFDSRVEKSTAEHYKFSRKYLGVVLNVNNFKYFAPLSSTKSHKDFFPDGKIRPSVIPLIRITHINKDESISLLGKIQLNNMIPVINDNIIKVYDLNKEKDIKYKNMVLNQIEFINKNEKLITKNANILYNNKIKNLDIGYINNTVNFKLLEEKALEYGKPKELIPHYNPLTGHQISLCPGEEEKLNKMAFSSSAWICKGDVKKHNIEIKENAVSVSVKVFSLSKEENKPCVKDITIYNVAHLNITKELSAVFKEPVKKEKQISISKNIEIER